MPVLIIVAVLGVLTALYQWGMDHWGSKPKDQIALVAPAPAKNEISAAKRKAPAKKKETINLRIPDDPRELLAGAMDDRVLSRKAEQLRRIHLNYWMKKDAPRVVRVFKSAFREATWDRDPFLQLEVLESSKDNAQLAQMGNQLAKDYLKTHFQENLEIRDGADLNVFVTAVKIVVENNTLNPKERVKRMLAYSEKLPPGRWRTEAGLAFSNLDKFLGRSRKKAIAKVPQDMIVEEQWNSEN